tara:strand:+ start:751 stop:1032 length:282 start_codon:yes stop_codon:yes gene_type:complete
MKKPICGLCAICFLLIGNLAFSVYAYIDVKQEVIEVEVEIPVSEDLLRLEAKIEAIYEECKGRDTIIFRTILEIKKEVTGLETISSDIKLAEL